MKNYNRDKVFDMITSNVADEVIEDELNKSNNINQVDNSGLSYLHVAVLNYRIKIIELLLEKGAKVDCVDTRGNTPLSYAIGRKNPNTPKIIKLLLDYNANLDFNLGEHTIRETIIMFQDPDLMEFVN